MSQATVPLSLVMNLAQSLRRLELLDVAHNRITTLDGIQDLISLQALRASHNHVDRLPCLTRLTACTEISLGSCRVTSLLTSSPMTNDTSDDHGDTGLALAAQLPDPREVQRGAALPTSPQEVQRAALPASLRRLSLARCMLPSTAACAPLRALTRLESLVLEGNPFTRPERLAPGQTHRLAALQHCPVSLRTLDLEQVNGHA